MKPVLEILELLSNAKTNQKKEILKEYVDHPQLKLVLYATLNPFLTYGIKQIPEYEPSKLHEGQSLSIALNRLLPNLANRTFTGNKAKDKLYDYLTAMTKADAEVLERIIKKDLKISMGAKIVNAVFEGYIPQNCYMGCTPFNQESYDNLPWKNGVVSQVKENGLFTSLEFGDGQIVTKTRKGNKQDYLGIFDYWTKAATHFIRETKPDFKQNIRLDGEILIIGDDGEYLTRSVSNGIAGKAEKGTLSDNEAHNVRYVVWDLIGLESSYRGLYDVPYSERFVLMRDMVEYANSATGIDLVRIVETEFCRSNVTAEDHYRSSVIRGLEGTVLKYTDKPWKDGKPTYQMKLKVFAEAEFKITKVNISEKTGTLGSFTAIDADGILEVNFGSGFTKKFRESVMLNVDKFIGLIFTGQFCEISQDVNGKKSLQNPVFIEIRNDKDQPDSFSEIEKIYNSKCLGESISSGKKS